MTKIVGLTGGIGSGKTTIANHFKTLGVPVYIADDEARILMNSASILNKIKSAFGDEFIIDSVLNRERLAQIVFTNPAKLTELNKIVHPAVKKHFLKWLDNHKNYPYIIKEVAILFESGGYKDCDFVITVVAPLESRIARVIKRDKSSREAVLLRINNQWTDEDKILKSDFVIHNDNVKEALNKTTEIHNILNNL